MSGDERLQSGGPRARRGLCHTLFRVGWRKAPRMSDASHACLPLPQRVSSQRGTAPMTWARPG